LCDWACLLTAEQERIDADAFGRICDRFGLGTFAGAMTALAAERLGTPLTTWPSAPNAPADLLLADILEGGRTVFAKKGGPWQKRTMLLRNMLGTSALPHFTDEHVRRKPAQRVEYHRPQPRSLIAPPGGETSDTEQAYTHGRNKL
ncbi:MAG: hypothetical protein ACLS37_12340, partial [Alistipes sp.]